MTGPPFTGGFPPAALSIAEVAGTSRLGKEVRDLNALGAHVDQATAELAALETVLFVSGLDPTGATDNTTLIQAALTAARTAGGGIVALPAGTFKVTADLTIGSNTTLQGAGRGATIIKRAATNGNTRCIGNYTNSFIGSGGTDTDIVIRDLTIWRDGVFSPLPGSPYDNTIHMRGVTRPSVSNCRVRGSMKAIHFEGTVHGIVEGCWTDLYVDNGIAFNWDGNSSFVGYNRIANNLLDVSALLFQSSSVVVTANGIEIVGNVFIDGGRGVVPTISTGQAIECGTLNHVLIADNLIKWTGSSDVVNSIFLGDCDDFEITGNLIEHGSINVTTYLANQPGRCNRISIVGNHLANTSGSASGIFLGETTDGLISGNIVDEGVIGVSSSKDVLVVGNSVSNGAGSGFECQLDAGDGTGSPFRVRFENNLSFNNGTAGTSGNTYGFKIDGGDSIELVNNRAYDTGATTQTHGLYVNATTNLVDRGNDFRGNVTADRAASTGNPTYAPLPAPHVQGGTTGSPASSIEWAFRPITAARGEFGLWMTGATFSGSWDDVIMWGYNADDGANTRYKSGEAALWVQLEADYNDGVHAHLFEFHLDYMPAAGSGERRPFFVQIDKSTDAMLDFEFRTSGITLRDWASNNVVGGIGDAGIDFFPLAGHNCAINVNSATGQTSSITLGVNLTNGLTIQPASSGSTTWEFCINGSPVILALDPTTSSFRGHLLVGDGGGARRYYAYNAAHGAIAVVGGNDGSDALQIGDTATWTGINMFAGGSTAILKATSTAVGFYGVSPVSRPAVTGVLSSVTDANAKTVLTSIITAITNLGLTTNGTT